MAESHPLSTRTVIGLMSGTSLDGVDLAACQFDFTSGKWNYSILHAETIPYPSTWKKRLIEVVEWPATRVYETDAALGKYFGQLIREFLSRWDLNADLIASHGHTLFHRPDLGFTTQIGSGASIAAETGLDTLCDFRSKDVALGGQGAPLVPLGDRLLFGEYTACLNLGGIANISYESNNRRVAYDICPVNMALNAVAQQLGLDFDPEGSHARSGIVDFELLQRLNNLDYYRQSGPKSLGREWYEKEFLPLMEMCSKPVDLLRTLSEHIAEMIAGEMNKIEKKGSLLTTGGGALNAFLLERIRALSGWSVIVPDKKLVEFKEALVFAFLGNLYMEDRNNVLSSSTGSVRDHVGGGLYKGN